LIFLAIAVDASAAEFPGRGWFRALEIEEVKIEVIYATAEEILAVEQQYRPREERETRGVAVRVLHGFSVLFRDANGNYRCEIYVPEDSPRTLRHETFHCYGWAHR
jgi:hypothetical protein